MNKLRFYQYSTWALLILNVIVLCLFLFILPPPRQRVPGPGHSFPGRAVEVMQLDQDQQRAFQEIVLEHRNTMSAIHRRQHDLVQQYFDNPERSDSIALGEIADNEAKKLEITLEHFQKIKSILNPGQLAGFQQFREEALQNILSPQKKVSPPPKDF